MVHQCVSSRSSLVQLLSTFIQWFCHIKEQEMSRVAEGNQMHMTRIKKNELVAVLYVLGQKKDVVLGHSWMQIHFYLLIIHIPNELKLLGYLLACMYL